MLTTKEVYQRANDGVYDSSPETFEKDIEEAFEMKNLPPMVKSRIHSLAWEAGHSAGYWDVVTQYFDLVDLVKICMESNEKT